MFMFVGYIGDYQKGNIGFTFLAMVIFTVAVSLASSIYTYFKKKDGKYQTDSGGVTGKCRHGKGYCG